MDAGEDLGGIEHCGARRDAVKRERGLRGFRNRLLRERLRQRFEGGVLLERDVRAFVGFDENENRRRVLEGRIRFLRGRGGGQACGFAR